MEEFPYDKVITIIFLSLWFVFPAGLFISFMLQHTNEKMSDNSLIVVTNQTTPRIESQTDAENRLDYYEEEQYGAENEEDSYGEYS